ncbi:ribosome silencing factor RsfS [Paenibacillus sp. 598K]|uniref:ribosome silencing factor n=1 Tax=Paenibacillus sp. 598K TaxID=1117987 RepID=UPI000FF96DDA|nr:ribosome silencing factor [Paenibacillus sp. 598K]GBF73725.1 ribosome silencing factor RsfS [Paenibacillus sp. 598K]
MTLTSEQLMHIAVSAAEEKKANRLVALNLTGISLVADYFVICHGNSDIQVQSIATEVRKQVEARGGMIRGIEGMDSARWVLMDLGDVVVHIFHRDERDYYNIERLWSDAKVVEFA